MNEILNPHSLASTGKIYQSDFRHQNLIEFAVIIIRSLAIFIQISVYVVGMPSLTYIDPVKLQCQKSHISTHPLIGAPMEH